MRSESLLAIYQRARRFALWASLLVLVVSALSVGALTWQAATAARAAAATAVSSFELELAELIEGIQRGQRRPGQVSSFEVDLEGRVRVADPAWLTDMSFAHNRAFLLTKPLKPGQVQVVFSPDPADMAQRVALWVRSEDGLSVATYRPENLFVPARSPEILVLDQSGICHYSPDSTLLCSVVEVRWLSLDRGRLLLAEARDLAQTRGYRLVVRQDVTREAWLIGVFLAIAAGFLLMVRAGATKLAADFEALEGETRAVGSVIESLTPPSEPGSGGLRDHLAGPLVAARQAELGFAENRSNVNLICRLGEEILELVEHLERRTQELHESERRLLLALQRAPIPLVLRVGLDELLLVNGAWQARSGYDEGQLKSFGDWLALAHPLKEGTAEDPAELYGDGTAPIRSSAQVTSASGELLRWELSSAPLGTSADGRALSVTLAEDVTERERVEAQSRLADKLRAVGELAGGIAHDFNNQLMAITASTELLKLEHPAAREQLDLILLASARSADLTAQLLAFARQGKHLDRAVDLHALIEEVAALLLRSVDKRVQIDCQLEARSGWVQGDPTQLQSAILNLGLNASHAMPEGGVVSFVTREVPAQAGAGEAPSLELRVSDTGHGIPAELRDQIFEPFFTTKGPKGTGLGLAAVYGTVQAHGGQIQVETEVGRGTTFRLELPSTEPPASTLAPPSESSRSAAGPLRALVVDDEDLLQTLLARFLELLGHEVTAIAATGREGIELFCATPEEFDFVLLDLGLPDMGGGDVLRELLRVRPDVPVVIASGYAENEIAEDLLKRGARGFLRKPFESKTLATAIERALEATD